MLTLAIGAAIVGAASAVNAASDGSGQFGTANTFIRIETTDPVAARKAVDNARARYGAIEVIAHERVPIPGTLRTLDVRDQAPGGEFGAPMLHLTAGRYPSAADEVALTDGAATALDAKIGDSIALGTITAKVVGAVENPGDLSDEFVLVAPGSIGGASVFTVLLNSKTSSGEVSIVGSSESIHGRGSTRQAVETAVLISVTMALALVALLAAAGFLVVAQRRQRHLGLLQAMGASDRSVRLVMIANGALVALVAAIGGLGLGLIGWFLVNPAVETAAGHRIDRLELPWSIMVAIVGVAMVMAVLAAWWPARAVSRLPVMAALSGRPAEPRPVHRSLLLAVALLAGGAWSIAHAGATTDHVSPPFLIGGLLASVLGVVFVAPAAIRILARIAPHLPFAPRLALRDLARFQARAAAALAAIVLGLGIAVSIVGVAAASNDRADEGNLSSHELLIEVGDRRTAPDPTLTAEQVARLDERAAGVVAALGQDETSVALDIAFPPLPTGVARLEPVSLGRVVDPHTIHNLGFPFVASPEVLALYGLDPSMIRADTDVLTSRTEPVVLVDSTVRVDPTELTTTTTAASLPVHSSAPNSLITPSAMARHGWRTARAAWIVESNHSLTAGQISAARRAASDAGLAIEVRDPRTDLQSVRKGATLIGALLAVAIVAMAVGLIRGEAGRDVRTLTATGAGAGTRRALAACTAAAFAVLGVLLGIGGAYVVLVAAYHADIGRLTPVPLVSLLWLAIGLPVAATVAGWFLGGSEPREFARQALD